MTLVRWGMLLAASGLVVGCSSSIAGSALPTTTSSTTALASGPRTFNLTGVDPCALIPPANRPELGLDQPQDRSTTDGQPFCGIPSSTGPTAAVFVDFRKSAQDTVAPIQNKIVKSITIDGFIIPLLSNPGGSQCEGFVQTGPSQYMSVATNGYGKFPVPELCKDVQPLLKIAIDTLKALQPS